MALKFHSEKIRDLVKGIYFFLFTQLSHEIYSHELEARLDAARFYRGHIKETEGCRTENISARHE